MEDIKTYLLDEAHQYFAQSINGRVCELLQKPSGSSDEGDEMLNAAHACTYQWKFTGATIHQQPGEWLISRLHVVLGHLQETLRHAERCFQLTEDYMDLMADFDIA